MLDDREVRILLVRTAAKEVAAFERLYRLTAPLLLGIAMRVVGRRELAEEVVHEAFIKIWKSAGTFDPTLPQPVAWMVAIVRHRSIDMMNSADVARVHLVDEDADDTLAQAVADLAPADAVLETSQQAGWVRRCIDELAPPQRQALVLAYHHGMSHGELAEHLRKPLGTVKSWVRRAMESVRVCVETCSGAVHEARNAS